MFGVEEESDREKLRIETSCPIKDVQDISERFKSIDKHKDRGKVLEIFQEWMMILIIFNCRYFKVKLNIEGKLPKLEKER